jgi:inosine/xanthosine triphosphatase
MKVHVGSKNKTKVDAVAKALAGSEKFKHAEVVGVAVEVPEFGHPKSLQEVVEGAIARATQAAKGALWGVGIEGGLIAVPYTKGGYMEITACAIFDGEKHHLGLSPAFEWPLPVLDGILNKGLDGSQAVKAANLTNEEKLGTNRGTIHLLTNGQTDRTEQNSLAVLMALVHLEHPELYQK